MIDRESENTLQAIKTIDESLSELVKHEPDEVQERFTNALLNIAIHRLIEDEGSSRAATILWRIVEAIEQDHTTVLNEPIELNQLNA